MIVSEVAEYNVVLIDNVWIIYLSNANLKWFVFYEEKDRSSRNGLFLLNHVWRAFEEDRQKPQLHILGLQGAAFVGL